VLRVHAILDSRHNADPPCTRLLLDAAAVSTLSPLHGGHTHIQLPCCAQPMRACGGAGEGRGEEKLHSAHVQDLHDTWKNGLGQAGLGSTGSVLLHGFFGSTGVLLLGTFGSTQERVCYCMAIWAGMPRTIGAFKAEGISIIREYFDSSDVAEVARRWVGVPPSSTLPSSTLPPCHLPSPTVGIRTAA